MSVRLARLDTADGPRQALVGEHAFLPPGDRSLPGVDDPGIVAPLSLDTPLLPPLRPSKVVAIGRNYVAHAAELGNEVPARPLIFLKAPSSLAAPGQPIELPPDSERVEHEAELAVVIGRRCRHVDPADAASVIFGYTACNDVTARDLQRADTQFARGKGFDTFLPLGPWVVVGGEPQERSVRCRVRRGERVELRQEGRTSLMVFDVPTLVAAISRVMTLLPGDVVATGTPAGVGPLRAGDVVEVDIEGIGVLSNPVVRGQAPSFPSPIGR